MVQPTGRRTNTLAPKGTGIGHGFCLVYELSRSLHRAASRRAERLGPIRMSPLQ